MAGLGHRSRSPCRSPRGPPSGCGKPPCGGAACRSSARRTQAGACRVRVTQRRAAHRARLARGPRQARDEGLREAHRRGTARADALAPRRRADRGHGALGRRRAAPHDARALSRQPSAGTSWTSDSTGANRSPCSATRSTTCARRRRRGAPGRRSPGTSRTSSHVTRRRHRRPLAGAQRVDADRRLVLVVLAVVDEDLAAAQRLRHPRRRRGPARRPRAVSATARAKPFVSLVRRVGRVQRDVDLHALGARGLRERLAGRGSRTSPAATARPGSTRRSSPAGPGRGRRPSPSGARSARRASSDVCSSSAARLPSQTSVGRSLQTHELDDLLRQLDRRDRDPLGPVATGTASRRSTCRRRRWGSACASAAGPRGAAGSPARRATRYSMTSRFVKPTAG